MPACWATRGCDEEMQSYCPHSVTGDNCPVECHYAACKRPTRKVVTDPLMLLDETVDRTVNVKDTCVMCEFFLTNAPRIQEQ